MAITTLSKNLIRDYLATNVTVGKFGTSATTPSAADTDLGAVVSATAATTTNTTAPQSVTLNHIMLSTVGNGTTFKEYGIFTTGGTLVARVIFPDLDKNSTIQVNTSFTLRVD